MATVLANPTCLDEDEANSEPEELARPPRHMCRGKVRYHTEAKADGAIHRIWRRARGPLPSRAYLCPLCGGWHLTTQKKRGRR